MPILREFKHVSLGVSSCLDWPASCCAVLRVRVDFVDLQLVSLFAGGWSTGVVDASGTVYAWGLNNYGQVSE